MSTTRITRRLAAPRATVYRALLDPEAVAAWMFPDGMTIEVRRFEPHVGGAFRIALTYEDPARTGKTSGRTDVYGGRFVVLESDERVVQRLAFETDDPALQGEMRLTFALADVDGGTELTALHENVPPGVDPADNELGWSLSLARLAALLEPGVDAAGR